MSTTHTATLTICHPTKWGPGTTDLREVQVSAELRRSADMPGRYYVLVNGRQVGWVTRLSDGWSACRISVPGQIIGRRVADNVRTRREAVDELLWSLRNEGVVAEVLAAAWEAAAA